MQNKLSLIKGLCLYFQVLHNILCIDMDGGLGVLVDLNTIFDEHLEWYVFPVFHLHLQ